MSKVIVAMSYIDPEGKGSPLYIDVLGPFARVIFRPDEVVGYRVWRPGGTRVGQILVRKANTPNRWQDTQGALFTHIEVFPEEEAKVIAPKSRRQTVILEKSG